MEKLRLKGFSILFAGSVATLFACSTAITREPSSNAPAAVSADGFRANLSADKTYNGSILLVRVDLDAGKTDKITGKFGDIDLPFFAAPEMGAHSFEAVIGVPYETKPGPAHVMVQVGDKRPIDLSFEVTEGSYGSEKLTVAPGKVNPPKKAMIRIAKEATEINPLYRAVTPKKYWSGPFRLPIDSKVTSEFGTKRIYNGEPRSYHPGLDLKAPIGTPIHAPAGAIVVMAQDLYFTGNTVILDHGYGVITLYAHMSELKVKKGQVVQAGDLLGLSGKTGRVTGPHLHWGAIIHRQKVNPFELTQVME